MENAGDGMAVDGMLDEEEVVDEVKAGKKLCEELVVGEVRVDIVPVDEVADDVRVAAVDEVRDDVTPIGEVKNDVVPVKEVVDDVQVVAVLGGVVAVDKGVDVAVVADVVLGNDVVVDVVLGDDVVADVVLGDDVVADVVLGNDVVVDVVLDDEIVVDVVLDDGIGVDVVLDDEVVVEVDEMVANGVAVVGLDVGFDVVAVTPRKKKEVFNRFDKNQFICCANSCVEFPCPYQLKIQCESSFTCTSSSLSNHSGFH